MRNPVLVLGAWLGLMLVGCSTAGRSFDSSKVAMLAKGTTTKAEVTSYFGKPLRTDSSVRGGDVWYYTFVRSQTTGIGVIGSLVNVQQARTSSQHLTIEFAGEVVLDFEYHHDDQTTTYLHD